MTTIARILAIGVAAIASAALVAGVYKVLVLTTNAACYLVP